MAWPHGHPVPRTLFLPHSFVFFPHPFFCPFSPFLMIISLGCVTFSYPFPCWRLIWYLLYILFFPALRQNFLTWVLFLIDLLVIWSSLWPFAFYFLLLTRCRFFSFLVCPSASFFDVTLLLSSLRCTLSELPGSTAVLRAPFAVFSFCVDFVVLFLIYQMD